MNWQGRNVWIIGASSGIGAALATALNKAGATLTISARNEEKLSQVSAGAMKVISFDISDHNQVKAACAQYLSQNGKFDVVVLMAGHWQQMSAFNFNYSEFVKHQEVNLFGFASCISEILPKMIESNQGVIAGVSSVAGYRGLSGGAAYGASKAAQLNLLESLRVDLQKTGVRVQTISPGFVKTPMTDTNDFPMPFLISAEVAAKAIVAGLERGKAEIVFPLPMSILMKSAKLIPQSIWPKLFSRSAKKP